MCSIFMLTKTSDQISWLDVESKNLAWVIPVLIIDHYILTFDGFIRVDFHSWYRSKPDWVVRSIRCVWIESDPREGIKGLFWGRIFRRRICVKNDPWPGDPIVVCHSWCSWRVQKGLRLDDAFDLFIRFLWGISSGIGGNIFEIWELHHLILQFCGLFKSLARVSWAERVRWLEPRSRIHCLVLISVIYLKQILPYVRSMDTVIVMMEMGALKWLPSWVEPYLEDGTFHL